MPPFRRAYNQLKIKVRALPTWRNPVGEGAKRTRGLWMEGASKELDIEGFQTFDGTVGEKMPSRGANSLQPPDSETNRSHALYLKPVVIRGDGMKPLKHQLPSESDCERPVT